MLHSFFSAIEAGLSFLPFTVRILLWGAGLGALTMFIYSWLSPQERIGELQEEASEARKKMREYDGTDIRVVWRLAGKSLGLAFKQLGLAIGPTLLAALPIVAAMGWFEVAYTHTLPEADQPVEVHVTLSDAEQVGRLSWEGADRVTEKETAADVTVRWPDSEASVRLRDTSTDAVLLTLPLAEPRTHLGPKRWWHHLLSNPVGYLPAKGPVRSIELSLPIRSVHSLGPVWLRTWHAPFLLALSIAALLVKILFRIN